MKILKENYTIILDEQGQIVSLQSGGKEFVGQIMPLLQFRLRKGCETELYTSNDADAVSLQEDDGHIIIDYQYKELNMDFQVRIICGRRIEYTFSLENRSKQCIEWIDFPQIAVPNDLVAAGGSGRVVLDVNEGLLINDLAAKEAFYPYSYREMEYPSEGLYQMFPAAVQSQFMAYYDDTCGLYMAAEDKERSIKGVNFGPYGEEAIKLQFRLYPGIYAQESCYQLPYAIIMELFQGDWHDAAELYRRWFETNLPHGLTKTEYNHTLPEWYLDSPLVVTYPVQGIHDMDEAKPNKLFPYHKVLPYLEDIAAKTGSRILDILMHWEGTAPWAPPYVWPPLGGEEIFKDFCKELHKRNFLLGVYCSGISYTIHSNINNYNNEQAIESEGLKRFMCTPPGGGEPVSNICQGQRKSYDMCISQEFTKQVLCEEARKMASSGLDYIQILDQNHGGTPYFCYSMQHGHPPVPGKWMVEHMTDFLQKLKETVGDRVLLGCESAAAEAYVPYLNLSDNRFNLNYYPGRPIPLYGYIYHEYLQNFSGNSVCSLDLIDIHRSPDCHLLRVAYSYLAGDLMTLVINQDGDIVWSWGERDFSVLPEREPMLQFVKSATAYRRGIGKKYLVFGKMVKPCTTQSANVAMYKPGSEEYRDYPAVLTTAWEAFDGTHAQFLANYTKQEQICEIDLTGIKEARLLEEDGKVIEYPESGNCRITMPPCCVRMIEFTM